jgi:hypothetical protein
MFKSSFLGVHIFVFLFSTDVLFIHICYSFLGLFVIYYIYFFLFLFFSRLNFFNIFSINFRRMLQRQVPSWERLKQMMECPGKVFSDDDDDDAASVLSDISDCTSTRGALGRALYSDGVWRKGGERDHIHNQRMRKESAAGSSSRLATRDAAVADPDERDHMTGHDQCTLHSAQKEALKKLFGPTQLSEKEANVIINECHQRMREERAVGSSTDLATRDAAVADKGDKNLQNLKSLRKSARLAAKSTRPATRDAAVADCPKHGKAIEWEQKRAQGHVKTANTDILDRISVAFTIKYLKT